MKIPLAGSLSILSLLLCAPVGSAEADGQRPTEVYLLFEGDEKEPRWTAQNDDVMGGKSKGGAEIRDGALHFTGSLSLENNGGFSQVKIRGLGLDVSGKKGMKMKVMGDGRTYQFRLATNARHRGSRIAYSVEFPTTADEWNEIEVLFADLKPSHHGNDLDGPPADLSQVEEISLLIGDRGEGPFSLKVDWMRTMK
jgi:NADH dehydrogenase [ubiquinone] 1 alpha subcomplex assembly factor 1